VTPTSTKAFERRLAALEEEARSQEEFEQVSELVCEVARGQLCPSCLERFEAVMEHPPDSPAPPQAAYPAVLAQKWTGIFNAAKICDWCRERVAHRLYEIAA
jgi:hypothetical protein